MSCGPISEHDQPVAANVLDRHFEAERPNQRWVGDTTEFSIGSTAKLYLAAILDLYSGFIVGWALSAVNDRHLTLKALDMALKRRCPRAVGTEEPGTPSRRHPPEERQRDADLRPGIVAGDREAVRGGRAGSEYEGGRMNADYLLEVTTNGKDNGPHWLDETFPYSRVLEIDPATKSIVPVERGLPRPTVQRGRDRARAAHRLMVARRERPL